MEFIEEAHGGCDTFKLVKCEECSKQYYKKTNHIFGKKSFDRMKEKGYPVITPLEDGCECEHEEDDED